MARVEHQAFQPGVLTVSLYGEGAQVRSIEIRINGDGIPLKVGESFTGTVVSVTREVTER